MTTDTNVQTSAQPGPGTAAPASGPLTPAQASVQLEQLRTDRLAGKVLDDAFFNRADYLARVVAGEQVATPSAPLTMEQQREQQFSEAMKPPADLHEYDLGSIRGADGSDQYQVAHTSIATAFRAAGIPAMYGKTIVGEANRLATEFKSLQQAQPQVDAVARQMQDRWGEGFKSRVAAIDDLLSTMAEADPRVAKLVDSRPWVIGGSAFTMELLDRVAQHGSK